MLAAHFGGELVYVNPNAALPAPVVPRLAFGWHRLPRLYQLARHAQLFHFFNPDPFPYPFLLALPKPVVYTITSGVTRSITSSITTRPNLAFLRRMAVVSVPDARTQRQLEAWGLHNVMLQRPSVATHRFTHTPLPLAAGEPLRLLVASAPWTNAQFTSKGFDALLAAAQRTPDLHLTLLWRGHLLDALRQRIAERDLGARVTVIDETVDVNTVLASVHAAAVFATAPGIIKSYPHSLLDALAAGKPVLLNHAIPMADYVKDQQCGVVADAVTPEAILAALAQLRAGFATYTQNAVTAGQHDFTEAAALDAVSAIYTAAHRRSRR